MLVKEYRIPLPFTLEEYERGHQYINVRSATTLSSSSSSSPSPSLSSSSASSASSSRSRSHGKLPKQRKQQEVHLVEVRELPEWGESKQPAIYTRRIFYLSSRIPKFAARVAGRLDHLTLHEEAWNQYPYLFTQYTCPLFPDRLLFQVTTRHVENDAGRQFNVHNLSPEVLSKRVVDHIDIASPTSSSAASSASSSSSSSSNDDSSLLALADSPTPHPATYRSVKTGRGPLRRGWEKRSTPVMCAYKLVTIHFDYAGIGSQVEQLVHDHLRTVYQRIHRECFCWLDDWIDMSSEDLTRLQHENLTLPSSIPKLSPPVEQRTGRKRRWLKKKLFSRL